jgi:hypothetical protein
MSLITSAIFDYLRLITTNVKPLSSVPTLKIKDATTLAMIFSDRQYTFSTLHYQRTSQQSTHVATR